MGPLAGQLAIVTGAGRGIGRGCAVALASAGASVLLVSRNAQELADVAAEIGALGHEALVETGDVTNERQVDEVLRIATMSGRLSFLVNAAGTSRPGSTADYELADWLRTIETNLTGA